MAKIIITMEDMSNGLVKVDVQPSFKAMAGIMTQGRGLTAAHRVAMFALQQMRRASASPDVQKNLNKLILPH